MFTPNAKRSFRVLVKIFFPSEKGTLKSGTVEAEFISVPQSTVQEMIDDEWTNTDVLEDVLVAVRQVGDGQDGELSPEAGKEACMEDPCAARYLAESYFEKMTGGKRKRKTSGKRHGTG